MFVSKVNFDLILIGFCLNDIKEGSAAPDRWRLAIPLPQKLKAIFLEHTRLARLLQERYDRLLINIGIRDSFTSSVEPCYKKNSKEWKKFLAAYKKILTLNTKLNLPKPIVGLLNYRQQVEQSLAKMGFITVNYLEPFKKYDNKSLIVSKWEGHPSKLAHGIYAQGFYDAIVASKVIPIR